MELSERVCVAQEMAEGAGARVRRLFPSDQLHTYDPFVLLDEFFVDRTAGFPDHPHKGFEAITYMLEGAFRHRDNLGNNTEVGAGGVQRFSAGSGIVHAETPGSAPLNHGFQLWINLPRERKTSAPAYQQVDPADIPVYHTAGYALREIIGPHSPVNHETPLLYVDVTIQGDATYENALPRDFRGFVYVYHGAITIQDTDITERRALLLAHGESVRIAAHTESRFILAAGRPHDQPIRIRGSFVD
jgi:redox-sensitive bicupin YhaK (pirin superfamily)